jgi:hypothetical protein
MASDPHPLAVAVRESWVASRNGRHAEVDGRDTGQPAVQERDQVSGLHQPPRGGRREVDGIDHAGELPPRSFTNDEANLTMGCRTDAGPEAICRRNR